MNYCNDRGTYPSDPSKSISRYYSVAKYLRRRRQDPWNLTTDLNYTDAATFIRQEVEDYANGSVINSMVVSYYFKFRKHKVI